MVSDLEYERAKKESKVDNVVSFSKLYDEHQLTGRLFTQLPFLLKTILGEDHDKNFVVPQNFPVITADGLRDNGYTITPRLKPFFPERSLKKEEEITAIREVEQIVSGVYETVAGIFEKSKIKKDQVFYKGNILTSEYIKEVIFYELFKKQCIPLDTIVSSGEDAIYPHNQGSGPIKPHSFIIVDIFPQSRKTYYFGDMTRTFVIGDVSQEMVNQYDAVFTAQNWALSVIKNGVTGSEIHQGIQKIFKEKGYQTGVVDGITQGFIHGTGHGVGLDIHEHPRIAANQPALESGQVVTVEPGLYYLKTGGVRIEDLGVVLDHGFENFSSFTKELLIMKG